MPKNKAAVSLGRKGGKANTPAQAQTRSDNLEKARAARWPKKKAHKARAAKKLIDAS